MIDNTVLESDEDLTGLAINRNYFFVWCLHHCFVFSLSGQLVHKSNVPMKDEGGNIVAVLVHPTCSEQMILVWKVGFCLGVKEAIEMHLVVYEHFSKNKEHHTLFTFHSGFVISRNRQTLYACRTNAIQT